MSGVVTFSGVGTFFRDLQHYQPLIRGELLKIVREQEKGGLAFDFSRSISVHVRLGDFSGPDPVALAKSAHNVQLPLDWYVDTIRYLRSEFGAQVPVWLFSDGSNEQLSNLLQMPNVERVTFGSALADMLALSAASILVPSSTFSMWSGFLGQMPIIGYPGQVNGRLMRPLPPGFQEERPLRGTASREFLFAISKTYQGTRDQ